MKKICFVYFVFLILLSSCSKKKVTEGPRTMQLMDTVCSINAFDDGTKDLYDEIFARLKDIDEKFSVTNPESEISKINNLKAGEEIVVSPEVFNLFVSANSFLRITEGAFEPMMGDLIDLWGVGSKNPAVPSLEKINKVKSLIESSEILITYEANKIKVIKPGAKINLGAIVKGYAADECVRILKEYKVKKAVVNLGGNVYVVGKKNNGEKWTLGIKDPKNPGLEDPYLYFKTDEASVVTSGNYERFFEQNGKKYHHILDYKTGFPSDNGVDSVTVICKSSEYADALSTSFFVMGKNKSSENYERIKEELMIDFSVVFIMSDGTWSCLGDIDSLKKY